MNSHRCVCFFFSTEGQLNKGATIAKNSEGCVRVWQRSRWKDWETCFCRGPGCWNGKTGGKKWFLLSHLSWLFFFFFIRIYSFHLIFFFLFLSSGRSGEVGAKGYCASFEDVSKNTLNKLDFLYKVNRYLFHIYISPLMLTV